MPAPPPRRSMIQRPGVVGLFSRVVVLLLLEGITLGAIAWLRWMNYSLVDVPLMEIVMIFAAMTFAMSLGLVFTEVPGGIEHTFTRLGLATFCRTALPLLVVFVIWKYSVCSLKSKPIFAAVVFYAVGHFCSMILSLLPLKK